MPRVFFIGLVGVYRQCRDCGRYKQIARRDHKCSMCYRRDAIGERGRATATRTLVLTDKGREAVRGWRGAA